MENSIDTAGLVNISAVLIDPALPKEVKIHSFIRQTNNSPYRFISGNHEIISVFDDNAPSFESNFKRFSQTTNSTFLLGGAIIDNEKGNLNKDNPTP